MGKKIFDWRLSVSVDLRSLGLFRIAFGLCLFVDIFYRLLYVKTFYTDVGLMPRAALVEKFLNQWEMSFHLMSGLMSVQIVLFTLALVACVGLILGYYTRLCAFICWIFVCSMQVRNQVILHGGDDVFRLLLFWCQFIPLAAEFSLDKFLNPSKPYKSYQYLNVGTAGLLLQVCAIYFFTALLKWHPVWHSEGSAVYYALNLDQFTSPLGLYVRQFPELMRLLTFMTVSLEFLGPIFVLMPIPLFNWRMFFVVSFISFHFGLAMTMELGVFPWVCMAAWLAFIPVSFWNFVGEVSFARFKPVGDWLLKMKVKAPAPRLLYSTLNQTIAAVFLVIIIFWNLSHLEQLKIKKPDWLWPVMSMTETYQKWSMFAPYPRKDDGWYIMEGTLFNGEKVDIWSKDNKLNYDKPESVSATYRNSLWRKYLTNTWLASYNKHRLYLGRYLCRLWNDKHEGDQRVNTIEIIFMLENTPAPGQPPTEISKELVWNHYCFSKPDTE